MGLYDSVRFTCCKCSNEIEVQSKADICGFRNYSLDRVPASIANDIVNTKLSCDKCGQVYLLRFLEDKIFKRMVAYEV